jgi:hypothetical protein
MCIYRSLVIPVLREQHKIGMTKSLRRISHETKSVLGGARDCAVGYPSILKLYYNMLIIQNNCIISYIKKRV